MVLFDFATRASAHNSRLAVACWLLGGWACSLVGCSSAEPTNGKADAGSGQGGSADAGGASATGGAGVVGGAAAGGGGGKAGAADGGREASGGGGAAASGAAGASAGTDAGGGPSVPGEYGFSYRVPGDKNLDWLCTFNDGAESGYVYARLAETGKVHVGLAEVPTYSVELAQISIKGAVSALEAAKYDYGGGHHNDSLSFDYAGKSHSYYHSSFGFGFRSCQAMDCRNVYAAGTTTLSVTGCDKDRKLPEACVSIKADGSHPPLTDKFMKCPGDTQ